MPSLAAATPLAAFFRARAENETPRRPAPRRRVTGPLLMGDIVTSHRGEPLLLSEWRSAEAERSGGP
jgi:hypothetical protein